MKKNLVILIFFVAFQLSAQDNIHWETNYKVALNQAKSQNKLVLVHVFDNNMQKRNAELERLLFSSDDFKSVIPKVIFLKLEVSNALSYNVRLATHYLSESSTSGVVLVNQYNNSVGLPLTDFSTGATTAFISFLNSKL